MITRCPTCGIIIDSEKILAVRGAVLDCPRCRTRLEIVAFHHLPVFLVSGSIAIAIGFALSVHGFILLMTIGTATLLLWAVAEFLQSVLITPKLRRSQSERKPLRVSNRLISPAAKDDSSGMTGVVRRATRT